MKRTIYLVLLLVPLIVSCAKDIVDLTGDIQGTVKDYDSGELLPNCRVSLSPGGNSTSTDANGSFSFEDLEAGTYTLSFSKSGYGDETQEVTVVTGQTAKVNVYLMLPTATTGKIAGTIKDYKNGQLIANCKASLTPGGKSMTSSSSGTYEFTDLTPGQYSVSFTKAGYDDENTTVTVTAGKTTTVDALLKAKASFALSETSYDFGDLEVSKTFYFFNYSDTDCSFSILNVPAWLTFDKMTGTVKASGNETVTAYVDRTKVSEGSYNQNITMSYSGKESGSATLSIKMKKVVLTTPSVSIASSAENIEQNAFDISGSITATGGSQITNYGHCWNTTGNPTINDYKTDLGTTDAILTYKSTATNLSTYTTYYVRAYAKNAQGITYSDEVAVTTQDVASDKWDGNIATSFAGGSGTSVDPYLIKTGGQLLLMKDYNDKSFKLENNIDLDNHNWLPFEFKGNFDGEGYTIINLFINRTTDNQGLFSVLTNATVSNVNITGVQINAGSNNSIGALAGDFQYGKITNCSVTLRSDSKILGNSNVGGLVGSMGNGYADSKKISKCTVNNNGVVNILGENNVGGILGFMREGYNGQIESCSFIGSIKGTNKVGGIVGYEQYGKLNLYYCSVSGSVEGNSYVGGIFGACEHNGYGCTYIYASKANVSIKVTNGYAGGIFGGDSSCMYIVACYSNGEISSSNSSCTNICGIGVGADCELSYSTMASSLGNYKQLGYMNDSKDCTGTTATDDITSTLRDCYSSYASYYNLSNTWTWTGTVDGKTKSVSCPKLAWE